jgi:hypothetical protein
VTKARGTTGVDLLSVKRGSTSPAEATAVGSEQGGFAIAD